MKPTPTKLYKNIAGKAAGLLDQLEDQQLQGFSQHTARFALWYFSAPIDIFPDVIPFIGYLDDFCLVSTAQVICKTPSKELSPEEVSSIEDRIDAFTVTRNSVVTEDNLNLRMSGIYAWDQLHRNSARVAGNQLDNSSQLLAFLTESDFREATVNLDVAYVHSQDEAIGDVIAFGVSAIQRHNLLHNTYNTSLHFLASYPTTAPTDYADQGELLFSRISWTPHHTEDLIFLNSFWAIDQFTSPTRGPLAGGALGQSGVLFSAPGLGRIGAPIGIRTDNRAGTSLGYQMFFDHTKQQVIIEIGGQIGAFNTISLIFITAFPITSLLTNA